MLRRDREVRSERSALPGLILDGLMPLDEVIRSIRLGEFSTHWLMGEIFKTARICPSSTEGEAGSGGESTFDKPQALAAFQFIEALLASDEVRPEVVAYILKALSRHQRLWLKEVLQRLSWEARFNLLTSLPLSNGRLSVSCPWTPTLLEMMGDIQEEPLVLYAHGHRCLVKLYSLTRHPALLSHATASERDLILAFDMGL